MQANANTQRFLTFVQWLFYILAVLAILTGVVLVISMLNFSAALHASLPLLGALAGPLNDVLFGGLARAVQNLGWLLLGITVATAGTLVGAGRLVAEIVNLSARVARLEQRLIPPTSAGGMEKGPVAR